MPLASLDRVQDLLGGGLAGKRLLVLGVSYRGDVADTRNSPAATFVGEARRRGAEVSCADPLVRHWAESGEDVPVDPPSPVGFDAVVFAVAHRAYQDMDVPGWIGSARPVVFDADAVLSAATRQALQAAGVPTYSRGRGGGG
jgi:UDP-N-acetyl-D-mannosaminuronate dehydrogenase